MTILEIYQKYNIPLNLQRHMLSVAALASLISDGLVNVKVDKDLIVKTMLLHDMGNILKFNFSRPDLFDEGDRDKLPHYQSAQQKYKELYGDNPDHATLKIISEITNDERIVRLCADSHWERLGQYLETDRWDIKICCYSDMRTGPFGLLTLQQRIDDLKQRRPEESESLDVLLKQGLLVEKQLVEVTDNDIYKINSSKYEETIKNLSTMTIE